MLQQNRLRPAPRSRQKISRHAMAEEGGASLGHLVGKQSENRRKIGTIATIFANSISGLRPCTHKSCGDSDQARLMSAMPLTAAPNPTSPDAPLLPPRCPP